MISTSEQTRWRSIRRLGTALMLTAACALTACSADAAPASDPLVVRVDSGRVRGAEQGGTTVFSGIRYAAAPVGDLRWREPRPPEPWQGVADATKPGPMCPQAPIPGGPPIGEDCLRVNVTAPKDAGDRRLPVMVWWHGGGYTRDAGSLYGARRLAERGDVVVVTLNYRLGAFGYFGYPGLTGSGDFGLADQLAGMRWTKRNIAAFGGDPGNVTLFGQSAGAMSTCAALTSPAARGLFDKAIMSSGACDIEWPRGVLFPKTPAATPYAPVRETEQAGRTLAAELGCARQPDVLDCLRGKPTADLVKHAQEFSNHLSYGTPLLPQRPAAAVRAGRIADVPVISGGNRDEQRAFVGGAATVQPITAKRYPELIADAFGDRAGEVARRYPLADYDNAAQAWAAVTTDRSWACPTMRTDAALSRHTKVYAYEFGDRNAPNVNRIMLPDFPLGAAHASDLPSLFDLPGGGFPLSPAQRRLSETMIDYWTRFAHTGDPNGADSPRWQRFSGDGPILGLVPDKVQPVDAAADHRCSFWNTFG